MNISDYEKILYPLGFICHEYIDDYFFELPNPEEHSRVAFYFLRISQASLNDWRYECYPDYENLKSVDYGNTDRMYFDLVEYAKRHIKTYKEWLFKHKIESIEQDFK